ncbi:MAG: lipase family protein [Rickettsiales endosymbiont of Dermacentor nuttalli]
MSVISYLYNWWYQPDSCLQVTQSDKIDNHDSSIKPSEESLGFDVDDYEFINPPDDREVSISLPYQARDEDGVIAGFDKEKLLEMSLFSKISYGNNDDKLQKLGYKTKAELIQDGYAIIPFSNKRGLCGFIFAKGKEVSIAYRGTQTMYDVCTDVNASSVIPSFLEGGMCHKGFYDEFKSSWQFAYKKLNDYAKEQGLDISDLDINLTGHSMGGALAKIAALWLNKKAGVKNIYVATFGDPRVFDFTASQIYNESLGEFTLRVTQHRQDPVPTVPQGILGFAHVGQQLRIPTFLGLLQVHKIDGYNLAIKNLTKSDFKANNNVSWFYYPSRVIGTLVCNLNYYVTGYNDSPSSWSERIKQEENNSITAQLYR